MVEANIISLLRTLVVIVVAYYLFKVLFRYIVPMLFRLLIKKYTSGSASQRKQKKEGEISVDAPPKSSTENDNLGEYVDFEEIEEKPKK